MVPSACYILAYMNGHPVTSEDQEYHVVDHILAFAKSTNRIDRIMAGAGVREMRERNNPWLHRLTPQAEETYRWFMRDVCGVG